MKTKGNVLANSLQKSDGSVSQNHTDNIGCPSEIKEVESFIKILKATSAITDANLAIIAERF